MKVRRPTAAFWRSPSGRLHQRRQCTGAGPANRMRQVRVTEAEYLASDRCRCARWRGPDRFVVVSRRDPAFPGRTNHFVLDVEDGTEAARSWGRKHLAQAEADRRNSKHRAFHGL